ncbi:hypothetical protein FIBSPDRAFT_964854 [Athelia psychrophila]|uniref:Uncharacterized protein n=1 Tax=Athelia psychrophila TaxID=1759441 RepID=A0A165XA51_9AGAM|nr:hypothetical protein FIBSPDRAFT_964854 [Fibularhizoctonia sp. CBS 109695]
MPLRHTVGSVVVNADPKAEAIFALQTRVNGHRGNIEIFTIDFGVSKFVKDASTIRKIHDIQNVEPFLLQGSTIIVRDTDGDISPWNIDDLSAPKIKLRRRQAPVPDWGLRPDAPEAILLRPTYAIIAYTTSVEIYPLPQIPQGTSVDIIVVPLTRHKWQWPLNRGCMVEQGYSHLQHDPEATPRPIDLLIRFGSVLPWPINIVHHFVLRVNSDYQPSLPVTAINIPYLITPQLMQSLSSPIRLFFWADMALGPYGTALIIDSNQDESQNDLAQRLAGQMLCRLGNGSGSDDDMLLATSSNAVVSEEPVNGFPSMAFLVRDQDTWTRVTMDEQAGKVAFARVDGGVELLEYI